MTIATVQAVVAAARQLSPPEQLEVIQALTRVLQQSYLVVNERAALKDTLITLPSTVRRTLPVSDIRAFAADFWPEDETADDINSYIAQQRVIDRASDLPEFE